MAEQFEGSSGAGSTASTTEKVSGRVKTAARELKENVTERASEKAHSAFDSQKIRAVESVSGIASALRDSADSVGSQNASIGNVMRSAADMIENVTRNIEGKDLDQLVWDVQSLARRNPVLFFGGALAVGFAAARFLKASNDRYISNYGGSSDLYSRYDTSDSGYGIDYASELGTNRGTYGANSYGSGNPVSRPGSATSTTLSDSDQSSVKSGLVSYGEEL